MNIQISGLPDNQKIKSINFNIVFDDSCVDTPASVVSSNISEPKYSIETIKSTQQKQPITTLESKEEIIKPEEIDISKRVAKIDPNMLDEVF